MNYYPFNIGDYAAHTAHLDPIEDLAYRRMLDAYYLREAALPADPAEVARIIRLRQHKDEVAAVLREFFTLTEAGWRHHRCDDEIERMQDKQAKARASAAASVEARRAKASPDSGERSAPAERTLDERSTPAELPTPTPTPTPTPEGINPPDPPAGGSPVKPDKRSKEQKAQKVTAQDLVAEGIHPDFVDAWLQIRRDKGVTLTVGAWRLVKAAAAECGLSPEQAVKVCIECSWAGFRVDWYRKQQPIQASGINRQEAIEARNQAAVDAWLAQQGAGVTHAGH